MSDPHISAGLINNKPFYLTSFDHTPENRPRSWIDSVRLWWLSSGSGRFAAALATAACVDVPVTMVNDITTAGAGVIDDVPTLIGSGATLTATLLYAGGGIIRSKFKDMHQISPKLYNQFLAEPLTYGQALRRYITEGYGKGSLGRLAMGAWRVGKVAAAATAPEAAAVIPGPFDDIALLPLAALVGLNILRYRNPCFDNAAADNKFRYFVSRNSFNFPQENEMGVDSPVKPSI